MKQVEKRPISQVKCRIPKELERKQLIYCRACDVTVPPYKPRALETLRRACSVSLMYMFLAVQSSLAPDRREYTGHAQATMY